MGGGSFNYLSMEQVEDLFHNDRIDTLKRMATRLLELGADIAAQETLEMLDLIQSSKEAVEDSALRLNSLFKAVEWLDSNDIDEESVQETFSEYLSNRQAPASLLTAGDT